MEKLLNKHKSKFHLNESCHPDNGLGGIWEASESYLNYESSTTL